MKFNDVIHILETIITGINDPRYMKNKLGESDIFKYAKGIGLNNSMNNNINVENESINKENNKSIPLEDSKYYNDNKSNGYYNEQQDTCLGPQGVIDSITQEMTPVRLEQAIILSEIVGKPRSKTRKKRRF
ncbi:hypothetical protein psyc5s11_22500 [Clostridium gelidum]|uniref:Uncharacterized protein n=1 Tax=Clostridium gelidum TaxID=704125 RepID=A0ABM7TB38_9CLOT|nr:hypothetical protein [Clostridium gelidum]BCZ46183.1 hypothetical protein psyc5s11_22500 [Clostridium gelidum]